MSNSNNNGESLGLIGCIIAAILSWQTWHSLGWAVIHCLLGWLYVFYWMIYYWKH
jgi:hypothetical protein